MGAKSIFTDGSRYSVLAARTNGRQVKSFRLFVGPPGNDLEPTRAAAFFDLDKTLIEGSSAVHFAARRLPLGHALAP